MKILLLLLALLLHLELSAQPKTSVKLQDFLEIVEDSTNLQTFEQIKQENAFVAQKDFSKKLNPNSTYWGRLYLKSSLNYDATWVLHLAGRFVNFVEVYFKNGEKILVKKSGVYTPNSQKDIVTDRNTNKIKLLLRADETLEIYIKIWNIDKKPPVFDVMLESMDLYQEKIQNSNFLQGIFQGFIVLVFLNNLLVFAFSKDKPFIYYCLYALAVSLYFLNYYNFTNELFFPENPTFFVYIYVFSTSFVSILYLSFVRNFLETKTTIPKWDKLISVWLGLRFLELVVVIFILLDDFNYDLVHNIHRQFTQIEVIFYFILMIGFYQTKIATSIFVIIGTILLHLGLFISLIVESEHRNYYFQAGVVAEILLFSQGLGVRIRINRQKRIQAQEQFIRQLEENKKMQEEYSINLEDKVKERTEELYSANDALQSSNEELTETLDHLHKTQSRLLQSEKSAVLGILTATISHELNNPLNFISGANTVLRSSFLELIDYLADYQSFSKENLTQKIAKLNQEISIEELKEIYLPLFDDIDTGAKRIKEIVDSIRLFTRLDEQGDKEIDLQKNIDALLIIMRNRLMGKISLKTDFESNLPSIFGKTAEINQLFLNLLLNALEAVSEGGQITIRLFQTHQELVFYIADTGKGIEKTIESQIFEPFISTKGRSGMGLYIAQQIAQEHQAQISYQSSEKGSIFTVLFPKKV